MTALTSGKKKIIAAEGMIEDEETGDIQFTALPVSKPRKRKKKEGYEYGFNAEIAEKR